MSITAETAKEHANDPAVLCCRAEEGTVLNAGNLEDPTIFDDLVDSGLLNLDGCLTIAQVLGSTLTKTCDSLTPLTTSVLDKVQEVIEEEPETTTEELSSPTEYTAPVSGGTLKISIGEGKDIHIEVPLNKTASGGMNIPDAKPVNEQDRSRIKSLNCCLKKL